MIKEINEFNEFNDLALIRIAPIMFGYKNVTRAATKVVDGNNGSSGNNGKNVIFFSLFPSLIIFLLFP